MYRIAKDKDNLSIDCQFARGLTWDEYSIDKAYHAYKKMFPRCVIFKIEKEKQVKNTKQNIIEEVNADIEDLSIYQDEIKNFSDAELSIEYSDLLSNHIRPDKVDLVLFEKQRRENIKNELHPRQSTMFKHSRSAFTMIELIFVIVILGILAAVAIPKLSATRDDAKIASLKASIQTTKSALPAYFIGQKIASFTQSMTFDESVWTLSNNDCTATYTDTKGDKVTMNIYQDASTAPSEDCTGVTATDDNLSLKIEYDTTNGGGYVDSLVNTMGMQDTRIKLGGRRIVW